MAVRDLTPEERELARRQLERAAAAKTAKPDKPTQQQGAVVARRTRELS